MAQALNHVSHNLSTGSTRQNSQLAQRVLDTPETLALSLLHSYQIRPLRLDARRCIDQALFCRSISSSLCLADHRQILWLILARLPENTSRTIWELESAEPC